jgi:protein involved in polysaccharide export with SLBB domain
MLMFRVIVTSSLLLLVALGGAGCAGKTKQAKANTSLNNWLATQAATNAPLVYEVQPPDVIKVVAPQIKELDGVEMAVRSDGKADFNLVGELHVAGKTADQIAAELRRLASRFYSGESLDISVQITEFRSKMIYVFGQVEDPGPKPYTGTDTVLQVLADARLNEIAWPERIIIVRPHDDPSVKQKVTVDVKQMYETGQTSQNFVLENGDVVYVPPTPLAQFNITFSKLLFPVRPLANIASFATGGI